MFWVKTFRAYSARLCDQAGPFHLRAEVLSVVSTQYKSVLDAIRANSKTFLFVDEAWALAQFEKNVSTIYFSRLHSR